MIQYFPSMSRENTFSTLLRMMPLMEAFKGMDPDGISMKYDWDMEVCVSVMERIDNSFQWNDLHWFFIPKSDLIRRAKEWNNAFLQYCC